MLYYKKVLLLKNSGQYLEPEPPDLIAESHNNEKMINFHQLSQCY